MTISADQQLKKTLVSCFSGFETSRVVHVYDQRSPLAKIISLSYQRLMPDALHLDFDKLQGEKILEHFSKLSAGDLVILVQSGSFRLDEFRIRVHLFSRQIRVIEHPHLGRIRDSDIPIYIDALDYDPDYYQPLAHALKKNLDHATRTLICQGEHQLVFEGPMEDCKLNIGDYRGMKNSGGQFPIGEVFTELKELTSLNGQVKIFAFGSQDFSVHLPETSVVLNVSNGRVVSVENSCVEFDVILDEIKSCEKEVWIRELGFGLNKAMNHHRIIRDDVGTFERMCGIHLSLGKKHTLYPKPGFHKKEARFHVDVFVDFCDLFIDDNLVYKNDKYVVSSSTHELL